LGVRAEALGLSHHALQMNTFNHGDLGTPARRGVLTERLEHLSAQWRANQIKVRTEENIEGRGS
jgi:hypothetical protein